MPRIALLALTVTMIAPAAAGAAARCPDVRGKQNIHAEGPHSVVYDRGGRLEGCLRGRTVDLGPGRRATTAVIREPLAAVATRASTERGKDRVRVVDLRTGRVLRRATLPRVAALVLSGKGRLAAVTRGRELWIAGRTSARRIDRGVALDPAPTINDVTRSVFYRRGGIGREALVVPGCPDRPLRTSGRWRFGTVGVPDPDPEDPSSEAYSVLTSCDPAEGFQRVVAIGSAGELAPAGDLQRLVVSGRYVMTAVTRQYYRSDPSTEIQVMDLRSGERWQDGWMMDPVRVLLAPNGTAVASWKRPAGWDVGDPYVSRTGPGYGRRLDEDPALDPSSLRLDGDTAVWTVAGAERRYELPPPGR